MCTALKRELEILCQNVAGKLKTEKEMDHFMGELVKYVPWEKAHYVENFCARQFYKDVRTCLKVKEASKKYFSADDF